jgi:hypothetical protein
VMEQLLILFSTHNFVRRSLIGDFKNERRKNFVSVAFQRTFALEVIPTNAIKTVIRLVLFDVGNTDSFLRYW